MIKSIEQVVGGYRVAFRLNQQAQKPHCFSPIFTTLEELYQNHPDVTLEAEAKLILYQEVAPPTDNTTVALVEVAPTPPKPKRVRKGRKRK